MADSDDYKTAFAEVVRRVRADDDPVLTYGNGVTPDVNQELDAILESPEVKRAATWAAGTAYDVGDVVMPNPRDGHRYRCSKGGTSGNAQPTFNNSSGSLTSDNTCGWTEAGPQLPNIYDIRRACYLALDLKVMKASPENQLLSEGRGQASGYKWLNLQRQRDQYRSVGLA
jgi:hypothetical protein